MTHADLVELGRRWLLKPWRNASPQGHSACAVVLTELTTYNVYGEIPDVLGFFSGSSILLECKTSLADFRADKNKIFRRPDMADAGMGSQRWFLAPEGIIPSPELPKGWGLAEVTAAGKIKIAWPSSRFERNADSEIRLLISVLCRLNIQPEGHIAIKTYTKMKGIAPSKNKATLTIEEDAA
jgi:hypothetical protein